jgi:hypothetical protein
MNGPGYDPVCVALQARGGARCSNGAFEYTASDPGSGIPTPFACQPTCGCGCGGGGSSGGTPGGLRVLQAPGGSNGTSCGCGGGGG